VKTSLILVGAKEVFQIHAEKLDKCLNFLPPSFWSDLQHPSNKGSRVIWRGGKSLIGRLKKITELAKANK